MQGKDFIITGLQPWDIPIGSNAIDIAKEISMHNRVLYVNSALDQMTIFRNKPTPEIIQRMEVLRKKKPPLRKISESLWVLDFPFWVWSINELPDGAVFDFFNKLNNKKIFRYIRKTADELQFTDPVQFIDNDIYRSFYSKEILKPALTVYYRRDNLPPYGYWKKHAVRLEPLLMAKSNVIVCNSPQYAEHALQFNAHSYDIGQGVDLSAYDTTKTFAIPAELKAIPSPRIGYIGDINSLRLDPDLLYELAESKPAYSFVIIGGQDSVFASHRLHTLQNVYFPGSIAKSRVPEFMSAFDVCLNPQKHNEITNGNYPRKVDEYLAMGKPVIATGTATMQIFRDHVFLCNNLAEYQQAVEQALATNSPEKAAQRIQFARSHSWQNNVNEIYACISQFTSKH